MGGSGCGIASRPRGGVVGYVALIGQAGGIGKTNDVPMLSTDGSSLYKGSIQPVQLTFLSSFLPARNVTIYFVENPLVRDVLLLPALPS